MHHDPKTVLTEIHGYRHLLTALHDMGYLKLKHNSRLVFDPTHPKIDMTMFPKENWKEFYGA